MRKVRSTETRILLAFGLAVLVLTIVSGISIRLTLWLLEDLAAVSEQVEVLDKVGEVNNAITQTAISARLYAANRMESDFADWEKQRDEMQGMLEELEVLCRDTPPQNKLARELLTMFKEKVDLTTRESDRGVLEAAWGVGSRGVGAMRPLSIRTAEISAMERASLRARNEKALDSATWALVTIGLASILAIVLAAGSLVRIVRDLRAQRLAAEELERARRAAEAASVAKSAFLANMSHELRTPLTSILGYADLLLEPEITGSRRQDYLQTMRRSGEHLLQLISDILDVSKIEAGRMSVENVECRLIDVLADVDSQMRSRATEKGIDFVVEYETTVPDRVKTDPTRFRQILMNLVGNAVKFTDAGGVRVLVGCQPGAAGTNGLSIHQIVIKVIDTGVGISQEQQKLLFQPFMQADISTTRRFGGSGLGLSISRRLARMLGGQLTVQSELDKGSTFTLEMPMQAVEGAAMWSPGEAWQMAAKAGRTMARARRQLGARVLLAEDGVENREVLMLHLRRSGCEVSWAADGQQACELAMGGLRGEEAPFDVVLMDMQMPVMDGYTAVSRLRSEGYTGAIIALTAHAMKEDRDRCLRVGCDEYLSKPVDIPVLLEMIGRFSGRMGATTVAERVLEDPVLRKLSWKFCERTQESLPVMRENLTSGKWEELSVAAHKLAGAGGAYGFEGITQEAKGLERLIKGKATVEEIGSQLARLESACKDAQTQMSGKSDG